MKFERMIVQSMFWIAGIFLCLAHSGTLMAGTIKVILRYDDYSSWSNTKFEQELLQKANALGLGVLIGVIPFPGQDYPAPETIGNLAVADLPPEKIRLLQYYASMGMAHPAVHGYSHRDNEMFGKPSEFGALSKEVQVKLLTHARQSLSASLSHEIQTFIPPFNTFDTNTLAALNQTGYRLLSAGPDIPAKASIHDPNMKYLPGGPHPHKLDEIAKAIVAYDRQAEGILLISSHAYDFVESGTPLPRFRSKNSEISIEQLFTNLSWLKHQDRVEFTTVDRLLKEGEDLSAARFYSNIKWRQSFISRHQLLPDALRAYPIEGLYYPEATATHMYRRQMLLAMLLYGAIFVATWWVARYALNRLESSGPFIQAFRMTGIFIVPICGIAIITWKTLNNGIYFKSAFILTVCIAMLAAFIQHHFSKFSHCYSRGKAEC